MKIPEMVGTAEIAAMLGVSRQRVQQLSMTPGFPEPALVLTMGKAWVKEEVERWAEERGKP